MWEANGILYLWQSTQHCLNLNMRAKVLGEVAAWNCPNTGTLKINVDTTLLKDKKYMGIATVAKKNQKVDVLVM